MLLTPESFDYYGGDETKMLDGLWAEIYSQVATAPSLNAFSRTGSWSLLIPENSSNLAQSYVRRVFGSTKTTVGIAMAWWLDDLPQGNNLLGITLADAANAEQITLYIQSTGAMELKRGVTSLGVTSTAVLTAGAWNHIEFKAVANNTTGAFELRVNEVTRLNLTGIDTVATANVEFSQWRIGKLDGDAAVFTYDWYIDDIVVWDTVVDAVNTTVDFVGDVKVGTLYPIADTAQADWAKSTGSVGYSLIDETTVDDADYISTATDGHKSDFDLTALPGDASEIIGYCALPRALKTDAGTVAFASQFKVGTDVTTLADIPLTTAATYYGFIATIDPSTSAPFSPSASPDLRLERVAP